MKRNENASTMSITEVGQYVSRNYYEKYVGQYQAEFPQTVSSFIISKTLILKVLNLSQKVKGIRFMYGLADELNPTSRRILLIPCSGYEKQTYANQAIVVDGGYYDHLGEYHSLVQTCELIADFVKDVKASHPVFSYKTITRGGFFGKDRLLDLIKDDRCHQIRLQLSYKEEVMHPILEPLDGEGYASFDIYMNFDSPCPPLCGTPFGDDCLATKAVQQHALEEELDLYRAFRNEQLLHLPNGGLYYEMYYFISPFISYLVDRRSDKKAVLDEIYYERITPFRQLLSEQKYDAALELLKDTLFEWVEDYKLVLVES